LPTHQVTHEVEQAREAVFTVHVVFDYIKCKVIRPAEGPDGNYQQRSGSSVVEFPNEEAAGHPSEQQEKQSFAVDGRRVLQVTTWHLSISAELEGIESSI